MPRKARIDAPGALHHIIVRGIERRKIFWDDADRDSFTDRLGRILTQTHTDCFAWALIPNHAHLLLRTGLTPISTVMRRLLTGYAVQFNRRHRRHGHLFQKKIQIHPLPARNIFKGVGPLHPPELIAGQACGRLQGPGKIQICGPQCVNGQMLR